MAGKATMPAGNKKGRPKVPQYDADNLYQALKEWVDKVGTANAFDFGEYNTLLLKLAASGPGLFALIPFLITLRGVTRYLMFFYSDLKDTFVRLSSAFKGLANPNISLDRWSGDMALKVFTVVAHEAWLLECCYCMLHYCSANIFLAFH